MTKTVYNINNTYKCGDGLIVKILAENTPISDDFEIEHGLSLYIEIGSNKLLFDVGKSDLFIKNAKKLGVDPVKVDFAVISHGHYDHGGGLDSFLNLNNRVNVYIHNKAFCDYYSKRDNKIKYIGLNKGLADNNQIIFTSDYLKIKDNIELFSNVRGKKYLPLFNGNLLKKVKDEYTADDFIHEQNIIITEGKKTVLVAGCAHNGIVNIIDKFKEIKKTYPDIVIGGFHLYNHNTGESEDSESIKRIAAELKKTNAMFYTCHCTGLAAYDKLKKELNDKIQYISTGCVLEI